MASVGFCFIWAEPLKSLFSVKVQKEGWTTSWTALFLWIIICCMWGDYRLKAFSVQNFFCQLVKKWHTEANPIWHYFALTSIFNIAKGHRSIMDELTWIIFCEQAAFWVIYMPISGAFRWYFLLHSLLLASVTCNLETLEVVLIFKLFHLSHRFKNCLFPFKEEKLIRIITKDSQTCADTIG